MQSNVLVAVICCTFKEDSLDECIEAIKKAGFEDILLNFEGIPSRDYDVKYLQEWFADGDGFNHVRQFDQDQAYRLSRICIARNMCLDFAQQKQYDWILFVDSDVLIHEETKTKLFEDFGVSAKLRSGIVKGRGVHSSATYMFYPSQIVNGWQMADYFTCGYMAIHKDIFWRLRFRWGFPVGDGVVCSEDPLFGSDARTILGENWWGRLDLTSKHVGDLKEGQTSQF